MPASKNRRKSIGGLNGLIDWLLGTVPPHAKGDLSNEPKSEIVTEALIEAKKEMLSGFRSVALQGGAFLVIVFSWTLTSPDTQRFLADPLHKTGAVISIIAICAILFSVLRSYRVRSQLASYGLDRCDTIPSNVVECYAIKKQHMVSMLVLYSILCIVLCFDICFVEPPSGKDKVDVWIKTPIDR